MFGLLDCIKIGTGAALGALVVFSPAYFYGKHEGRQAAVEAVTAAANAFKDRTHENATVEALGPVDLCIELGGLRDDCRAELPRLAENPGAAGDGGLPGE